MNAVFKVSPEFQAMQAKMDFFTGDHDKDMSLCGKRHIFHPLVMCTVDWKRFPPNEDLCVPYAICVATYTKLMIMHKRQ